MTDEKWEERLRAIEKAVNTLETWNKATLAFVGTVALLVVVLYNKDISNLRERIDKPYFNSAYYITTKDTELAVQGVGNVSYK